MDDKYLDYFKPLQIEVRNNDLEGAIRQLRLKNQQEQTLINYRLRSRYEKPSERRRREEREGTQRRWTEEMREKQILSGEWDRIQERKARKAAVKAAERAKRLEGMEPKV